MSDASKYATLRRLWSGAAGPFFDEIDAAGEGEVAVEYEDPEDDDPAFLHALLDHASRQLDTWTIGIIFRHAALVLDDADLARKCFAACERRQETVEDLLEPTLLGADGIETVEVLVRFCLIHDHDELNAVLDELALARNDPTTLRSVLEDAAVGPKRNLDTAEERRHFAALQERAEARLKTLDDKGPLVQSAMKRA